MSMCPLGPAGRSKPAIARFGHMERPRSLVEKLRERAGRGEAGRWFVS